MNKENRTEKREDIRAAEDRAKAEFKTTNDPKKRQKLSQEIVELEDMRRED